MCSRWATPRVQLKSGVKWCPGAFSTCWAYSPQAGRFFSDAERDDAQNAHAVVVISHSYWKNHYHSDRSAIGATLRINRTPFTIIGVAPEGFHGTHSGLDYEMWMPLTMYGQLTHTGTWMLRDRNARPFMMFARLAPGVTIEQARAEVQALANRMAVADADSNQGIGATVLPVWQSHFGTQSILLTPITILMGASGVVLLIVCANLANLLLARATGRLKEFSVRLAMGATADATDPAASHRNTADGRGRLGVRLDAGKLAGRRAALAASRSREAGHVATAARRAGPGIHHGAGIWRRHSCGTGSGAARDASQRQRDAQGGRPHRDFGCAFAPLARAAGDLRGGSRGDRLGGRGIIPEELPNRAGHRSRLQAGGCRAGALRFFHGRL